jgi:hypothetical protein
VYVWTSSDSQASKAGPVASDDKKGEAKDAPISKPKIQYHGDPIATRMRMGGGVYYYLLFYYYFIIILIYYFIIFYYSNVS